MTVHVNAVMGIYGIHVTRPLTRTATSDTVDLHFFTEWPPLITNLQSAFSIRHTPPLPLQCKLTGTM